ncbi:class I SAM-dependent methyltransferase [Luteipulveratus sp. YIM 133132]|uniref:Class I SAM-dependent methyltransferase n=1 Tax=Luteipulveratus flavus TaxID=3031728 RepID=A0ABT6C346_9MICO|nr:MULTISPECIES: class I SAM-dependent methyltransferase [unclassified Luteipulveratus]MDE9367566.1 class I SAM-dependent methyltransferase [Luteipulveratus sp. YIM 133132]MDF8263369.1 class I SAM-dependent methyltransferase [Luteipulveratus sp. YIM 133296]
MKDYQAWAEFGDVLRLPLQETDFVHEIPWDAAAFDPSLPLIDIGPGSGVTTVALAQRYPGAEVIAVEPDEIMRSLLMTRLSECTPVRERTTVVPDSILDAWLPEPCGGALLFNVIYFLGEREREMFWHRMAQVLVSGASVLMSRSYGAGGGRVERKLSSSARVGRHEYQRWFEAEPVSEGRVRTSNTYVVLRDDEVVREEHTQNVIVGLTEDHVVDEIPVGQFGIEEIDERFIAIRRLPDIKR